MSRQNSPSIILQVARTELRSLFCSPIAWFILIVFSVLTGISFVKDYGSWLSHTEVYNDLTGLSLTSYVYLRGNGFLSKVVGELFIYIPLLTMGLISRELSSGSIKLTYSSPVTSFQYVAGKYIASAVMGLCLLIVPLLSVAVGALTIPNFDLAPALTAVLGLYLLVCAYSAVGLFMSSLTSYQVVAAVGSLATFAILGNISKLGPGYDFIRNITHWISISDRTSSFLIGVIRTDDLVYFLTIIMIFVTLTVFRISFPRRGTRLPARCGAYAALTACVAALAFGSTRPGLTGILDTTRTKANSITEDSKDVLRKIDGKLTVNTYVNMLDKMSMPYLPTRFFQYSTIFEQYMLTKPDIEEHTIFYYSDCPYSALSSSKFDGMDLEQKRDYLSMVYNLNPKKYKRVEELEGKDAVEAEQYTLTREVVTADGKVAFLRDFNDTQRIPSEGEITAALAKLVTDPPYVGFMTGNGERSLQGTSLEDYTDFSVEKHSRYALVNQGFDIVQATFDAPVPEGIEMIVVADPTEEFTPEQHASFKDYIDRGGNMIILTDYGRKSVIDPLLAELGLTVSDRQIAQREGDFSASLLQGRMCPELTKELSGIPAAHRVTMPGAVALSETGDDHGFAISPLIETTDKAWLESDYEGFRDDLVSIDSPTETPEKLNAGFSLTRTAGGKDQRIVVLGDA
ncbi:MAG: Gldg family protein, partial [Bacteroidales bacterium]|nr:Gldg family protein [Bacteroidales bacterium]